MKDFRRSGTVVVFMAPAAPVWGVALAPSGLTVGRALILLAAAMLAFDWYRAPRPRPRLPRASWLLIAGLAALWAWTALNAAAWGCGTCGGDLYGFSELAAVCVLAAVICAFEPAIRSALVLSVLAGATLEAALALVGVHGLTPGTADTSTVQGRLAGTFGNPNELGIAIAFGVPAGLTALRIQPARWRPPIVAALALIVVALGLTLSRSGILAAAVGGAVVLVLAQPAGSSRRRVAFAGLLAAAAVIGISYPLFSSLRQHAESVPIDPALKARDLSGWDATRLGMVQTGGADLANGANDELEVRTLRSRQGVSHSVGPAAAKGRYVITFQARAISGSDSVAYGLDGSINLDGPVVRQAVLSPSWRTLRLRWRPTGDAPNADFQVWSMSGSTGFLLRDVNVVASPAGRGSDWSFGLDTRLKGSVYAALTTREGSQQRREIDSRLFAVGASLSAFATEPLRGIGWGHFVDYSSTHGSYGELPTHDEYLRFLAELGAIGALLLALVVGIVAQAAWNGARDELAVAVIGLLAAGGLALVFINGLVAPDVMMPLAFAAASACAQARVRPTVAREAGARWRLAGPLRLTRRPAGPQADPHASPEPDSHRDPTPTRDSPSPPRGYRPALDGLRGVSVLTIIAYHMTTAVPGGFLAVDVFFVLSGYLITSILLREVLRKGRIRLAEFWARRARRLLPAVMLLVLVCAFQIYHAADVSTWALRRSDLLSTLFYYANWHFIATDQSYFASFLGSSPVRHTWTLAIEEQFYLVWPLVVYAVCRLSRSTRALAGVIAAGIVASAIAMAAVYTVENPSRAYFGTDARASSLLIGAGLALLVARRPGWLASERGRALAKWSALPITVVALTGFALLSDTGSFYYHGGELIFAALVALAIFVVEAAPAGRMARVLSLQPLRWTGKISYGLYLWYWPVLVWSVGWLPHDGLLRRLAELAVIYVAAATSFYVLERPIREGRLPGLGLSRRRLAVAMPILLAAVAVVTVRLTTLPTASLSSQLAAVTPLACPQQQTAIGPYSWCPRQVGKPGAPVIASIGDSTSQSLYPGMRDAARRRGWTYIEAAEGGCSSLPLLFVEFDTPQFVARAKRCVTDISQIIRDVQARYHPDVWVLSDRWPVATMVTRKGKSLMSTDPRRDKPIEAALRSQLAELTAGGARVLLVPAPPPGQPIACAMHKLSAATCGLAAFSERDPMTTELTRTVSAAVKGLQRVTLVPITDVICPRGGQCEAIIDGTVVRYDGIHFSGAFSRKLVPIILERAQRLGLTFAPRRHA